MTNAVSNPSLLWTLTVGVIATIVALFSTITTGSAIESYKRYRDRRMLAAALRAEIAVTVRIFSTISYFKQEVIDNFITSTQNLTTWPEGKSKDFSLDYIPVYKSCVDKIGLLPQDATTIVVSLYANISAIIQMYNVAFGTTGQSVGQRVKLAAKIPNAFNNIKRDSAEVCSELDKIVVKEWFPVEVIINGCRKLKGSKAQAAVRPGTGEGKHGTSGA